jgi:hypothetical protein
LAGTGICFGNAMRRHNLLTNLDRRALHLALFVCSEVADWRIVLEYEASLELALGVEGAANLKSALLGRLPASRASDQRFGTIFRQRSERHGLLSGSSAPMSSALTSFRPKGSRYIAFATILRPIEKA